MQRMNGGKPPGKAPLKASYEAFHDVRKLSAEDPLAGAVLNERYEMIGRVGSGGMARIYLATDRRTGGRVAVKIIKDAPERADELTERLLREAKAAAMVNHPNIIGILDVGTYKDKIFCVMEYIEGYDLSALLLNRQGMGWDRAKGILAQILDALEAAHQKNVIHRDMKPENVMLIPSESGETVKVLDFGLARLETGNDRLTRDNIVLGTPSYMAPEQAWSQEYDRRVDLYAVGVMAYEMLTGAVPFRSDIPDEKARTLQVLLMHKETAPEAIRARKPDSDVPAEAESAIMRALEKDPARRFASAGEMKEALLGRPAARAGEAKKDDAGPEISVSDSGYEYDGGEEEEDGGARLPREEETAGRILKRAGKRLLMAGAVAAAILGPAYHFRNEILGLFGTMKQEIAQPDAETRPEARPQPSPVQTSYNARVESTPRGAVVTDVTGGEAQGRPLGRTPLDLTFQNWENVLVVTKRGYYPARVVITRSQPEQRVVLKAIPRQGGSGREDYQDGGTGGAGESETPGQENAP